ncbi:hypothetical protein SAMN04488498_14014 [Mesorhizobium albiziae]|uniref:Uncharacterized protein n=1 Tax=Neomesorhizobium albiziae TaxID=335020 RepID=A0A1I4F9R1_9HYPH|nr:hypothetical protein SAMN04488498_14014 [Mesorhizobium albiziae]
MSQIPQALAFAQHAFEILGDRAPCKARGDVEGCTFPFTVLRGLHVEHAPTM